MKRAFTVFAMVASTAASASAQEYVGTWTWTVSTDNEDAIVEPGESATILLSINFSPDVGDEGMTGERVSGLGKATFNTLGGANSERGSIGSWHVKNNLADKTGDLTTTDGVSLFGTNAQQGLGQLFISDDPIDVLEFEWSTDDYSGYLVTYTTSMLEPLLVWEGHEDGEFGELVDWSHIEAEIHFTVVPAPTSTLAMLLGASLVTRRRRSS
jgi:hypothetical protein